MERLSPLKALWGFVFIVALSPVVGKLSVSNMTPSFLLIFGSLITVFFYVPYITKNKLWKRFFDKDVLFKLSFVGLVGTALPFLLFLIALQYTTPANSAILNQFEVIYSLIFTAVILHERPTPKQLGGTALILAGAAVLLITERFSINWKGDIIIICTVWMFQLAHIAAKKLPADLSSDFLSCGRALFGFFWGIPLAAVLYFTMDMPVSMEITLISVLVLLFMGIFRYAIGNSMWYRAIRNMDLSKATALVLSYPVFTYIFSVIFGYDTITLYQISGLALALMGAYLVNDSIKKSKTQ